MLTRVAASTRENTSSPLESVPNQNFPSGASEVAADDVGR